MSDLSEDDDIIMGVGGDTVAHNDGVLVARPRGIRGGVPLITTGFFCIIGNCWEPCFAFWQAAGILGF